VMLIKANGITHLFMVVLLRLVNSVSVSQDRAGR
jgi:hypothetical protein